MEFVLGWLGSGFLAVCFMLLADLSLGQAPSCTYWLKDRGWPGPLLVIAGGPVAFLFGLVALLDFINALVGKEIYEYKIVAKDGEPMDEGELNKLGSEEWRLQTILQVPKSAKFYHFFMRSIRLR